MSTVPKKKSGLFYNLGNMIRGIPGVVFFVFLVILFSISLFFNAIAGKLHFLGFLANGFNRLVRSLDRSDTNGVSQLYLVEIAFKNMAAKKNRTNVTIGGMAIGISFIVFLVSIGYGLQELVVNRVARLDELKQAEVAPGITAELSLTDNTLANFKRISNVSDVLPMIAVIGRVSYQNSISDIAVYGTTTDYLRYSALQPFIGRLFESSATAAQVNGLNTSGTPVPTPQKSRVLAVTNDGSLPGIEIEDDTETTTDQNTQKVTVNTQEKKEAVVNQSVLQLLNIPDNEAIGKQFDLTYVVVGSLLDNPDMRIESMPVSYTIVGVLPDDGMPLIYVPFLDAKSLGISKYSLLKIIANQPENLAAIRTTITSTGFSSVSVADTVNQIDSLFASARVLFSILGLVALAVAALGMFNTLTVSLLERTREVGLMKAMGLKSAEVKSLFLTESMIMGLYGGIFGLLLGVVVGKILSAALSAFTVSKGVGAVDVTYVPAAYVFFVIALSILVGGVTGYYPAKRATRISALNALRYE